MPQQITVTLGERQYIIEKLPIRQSQRWRQGLAGPLGEIAKTLELAAVVETNQYADIATLIQRASGLLIEYVDKILDLLFAYSAALAADSEYIKENAYDDEALAAFVEVLKLAYPLDQLMYLLNGRTVSKTSSNSLSPNGTTGTKVLGVKATI